MCFETVHLLNLWSNLDFLELRSIEKMMHPATGELMILVGLERTNVYTYGAMLNTCIYICIYIYTNVCICVYSHTATHTRACIDTSLSLSLSLSPSLSLYIYIYTHAHASS